jgi:hypothetical protein
MVCFGLYGNVGGYIALGLYCFSPAVIRSSVLWFVQPNIAGAWGTFGAVFTGIAVSHTLYAPRVILMELAAHLAAGHFAGTNVDLSSSLAIVLPVLLVLMLYVAAGRRAAATAIFFASCGIGAFLLLAYRFQWRTLGHSQARTKWIEVSGAALAARQSLVARVLGNG